jgi:hypothetical protein
VSLIQVRKRQLCIETILHEGGPPPAVPLHHIHAAYVRSHFNAVEVGLQDSPRPDEILYALVAADGGRIHARLGGLAEDQIKIQDGQR